MGEDVKKYIDDRFNGLSSEIKKDLKWAVGITLSGLLVILGWMGTTTIKNRMYIKDLEYDMVLINDATRDLEYKLMWIAEVNELVKEFYKSKTDNEDIIDFLEQAKQMEQRIMTNGSPRPTLRSGYYKDDNRR